MRDHMRTRLRDAPFNLNESALEWVFETFDRLTYRQRIAQLFTLRGGVDAEAFRRIKDFEPGGITAVFGHDPEAELANVADIGNSLQVPPLISADLEGSRMSLPFGTQVTNPLGLAAINDLAVTAEVSRIMATEARAAGINWSFTPVLDINAAFRSAIVATRGFGSDPDLIDRHALTQIAVFQENGIAATAKHWPGEGFDDRDQHLLTTVNPLSFAEWERSFGKLYRAAINAGVLSVMSGHIAFPAFIRAVDPEAQIEAFQPASLSARLNLTLLRDTLGFNGLIVSDATGMAGLGSWCRTVDAMPLLIAAGCDMILFSQDPSRDAQAVGAAIERGEVSKERFDEAVLRVLGLKAALGLHKAPAKPKPAAVRPSATDFGFRGRRRSALSDPGQRHSEPAASRSRTAPPGAGRQPRHHRTLGSRADSFCGPAHARRERLRYHRARAGHGGRAR